MRPFRIVLPLLFSLLLTFNLSCAQSVPSVAAPAAQQAAHKIIFTEADESRWCSSTAVGPHTLLSAAHCVLGTGHITVDGQTRNIAGMMFDEWDHFLVVVDGPAFPTYLQIEEREPKTGEHIQIWGWPGNAKSAIHRDGVLLGIDKQGKDDEEWNWQLPVYHGDSGSGLVTDDNKVISVVSQGDSSAWSGTFPLQFSSQQLQTIQ